MIGTFEYVLDRGALSAFPASARPKYVKLMSSLVEGRQFRYLLCAYNYDQGKFLGPPHSVTEGEVEGLYGDFARVESVSFVDDSEAMKKLFGVEPFLRMLAILTDKNVIEDED